MNRIFLVLFCCLMTVFSQAETVKNITVSGKAPFTDHLSLKNDSKDMDLIVKFMFDEPNEALTVTLISYRNLFVFQDDVRYGQIKGCSGKLKIEKFPYVLTAEEGQKLRLTSEMKKAIPRPRKEYIFHRWMEYDGLIPQAAEFKLVNDFIEQKFDIKNKQNNVTFTLRNVFLMDQDVKKANLFWVVFGKDLNTKYQVTIQRDPCFGKDEDIKAAKQMLSDLMKAFKPFKAKYKDGVVSSQDALDAFQKIQQTLQQQFPQRNVTTECTDLQETWESYNAYVDSIAQMRCKVVEEPKETGIVQGGGIQPNYILTLARQIDVNVAKWQYSDDMAERRDLEKICNSFIADGNDVIKKKGVITDEQKKAVELFHKAVRYYKKTCSK